MKSWCGGCYGVGGVLGVRVITRSDKAVWHVFTHVNLLCYLFCDLSRLGLSVGVK